jgi:transposase InsO family protein
MRRAAARKAMLDYNILRRRACKLVGVDPKTVRRDKPPDSPEVRSKMLASASKRLWFGCRQIGVLLNDEIFDTLDDAHRKLALWRYDCNNVRPHSSMGNQTPAEAR